MNKTELIKLLEETIETVKDNNNYIVQMRSSESADIEKVTAHGDKGTEVVGLVEVGKNIDIDIDIEYVENKTVELEDE